MRIVVAVGLVLLIGVLDSSVAKRPKVPTAVDVLGKIRRFSQVGNLKGQTATVTRRRRDTSESVEDSAIIAECTTHGGPEAYRTAETNINTSLESFVAMINDSEFEAKLEEVNRTNNYEPFALYLCSKKGDFQKLVADIAEAAKPCFDNNGKVAVEVMKNLTIGFIGVFCQENGHGLANFLNTGGLECSTEKSDDLEHCLDPLTTDSSEEVSDTLNETEPETDDCHKMAIARKCIKKEFDTCHKPNNTAYIISVFDWFFTRVCVELTDATTQISV